jgi:signal transduction histidine kinase
LLATEKITLQLRWFHNFIFAGYYAAVEKGFYQAEGLEVSFIEGSATTSPVNQVLAGNAQFGTSNSRILINYFKEKPVVALATIFQHSPLVLITKKDSGINNLHDLVEENVFFDKNRDVEIAASFILEDSSGISDLLADPGMIEHAFVNLIQNSIHALSLIDSPMITIRTYSKDEKINFEIEDNGCGIPSQFLESIYEPSFTLKGSKDLTNSYGTDIKGSGYGMANVKKYIEQHKGSIFVESKIDSGTKITISMPVVKKE